MKKCAAILMAFMTASAAILGGCSGAGNGSGQGGVQLFCTGIVGEYLAKTYLEVKHRPVYITRETENDL